MGKMSTRMISASSHSKTALSVTTRAGDGTAGVAESDMPELGDSLGRASSSLPSRGSQPKVPPPLPMSQALVIRFQAVIIIVQSFIYSVPMQCDRDSRDCP